MSSSAFKGREWDLGHLELKPEKNPLVRFIYYKNPNIL
jgi:hypothetical protein